MKRQYSKEFPEIIVDEVEDEYGYSKDYVLYLNDKEIFSWDDDECVFNSEDLIWKRDISSVFNSGLKAGLKIAKIRSDKEKERKELDVNVSCPYCSGPHEFCKRCEPHQSTGDI